MTTTGTSSANGFPCGGRRSCSSTRCRRRSATSRARPAEIGISKRVKYLNDRPNYGHFLVDKKFGTRAGVSADFTSVDGARTWRAATNVNTKELRVRRLDPFRELQAHEQQPGVRLCGDGNQGAARGRSALNGGYASIDRFYGGLNSDRFHVGNRVFIMTTYVFSPRFTASAFITRAVGNDFPLLQRTLSNLIFSYNALPDIRRTGLF